MIALIVFVLVTPLIAISISLWQSSQFVRWLMPFGAGVLFASIFGHLLPHVLHDTPAHDVGWALIAGFGLYFVLVNFMPVCHHEELEENTNEHAANCGNANHRGITSLLLIGLVAHALLDGVALAVLGSESGTILGMCIHRAMDGLALIAMAQSYKLSKQHIYALLATITCATVAGFALGSNGLHLPLGILQAFTAGTLLYILTTDVIPAAHRHGTKWVNVSAMALGFAVMYFVHR